MLQFNLNEKISDHFDLHTAVDATADPPILSCVALYRNGWHPGWPALGGTRLITVDASDTQEIREAAWSTAKELALSMTMKNNLLRNAERALSAESDHWKDRPDLFGWQGGKGVIWAPRGLLTPQRLFAHGRLIDRIGGEYVGSKDQGVGTRELKWIGMATGFTIGLGCPRDTGEGTAAGVLAGLYQAARELGLVSAAPIGMSDLVGPPALEATSEQNPILDAQLGSAARQAFGGLHVLIVGLGKVGLPLLRFLHERGATCFLYDPSLQAVRAFYRSTRSRGAAVTEAHRDLLEHLKQEGRVFATEREALSDGRIQVVSPTGGNTGWLSEPVEDGGPTRYELLCREREGGSLPQLVLGAGNDQLPATQGRQEERDRALSALSAAGITFVPDPIVSPGGVVAVSHEGAERWNGYQVVLDSAELVQRSVRALFARARSGGGTSSADLYEAFEQISLEPGYDRLPAS